MRVYSYLIRVVVRDALAGPTQAAEEAEKALAESGGHESVHVEARETRDDATLDLEFQGRFLWDLADLTARAEAAGEPNPKRAARAWYDNRFSAKQECTTDIRTAAQAAAGMADDSRAHVKWWMLASADD